MTETVTDTNGLVWVNGGEETDDHLAFGLHEQPFLQVCRSLLPSGGVFVDVGAHVGLYTLNMAQKASVVLAVEANPKTYQTLLENIRANASAHTATVKAVNLAAWDQFGYLDLKDENGKETGGSTQCVPPKVALKFKMKGQTEAAPLDYALPDRITPDLVKIDVEGAEARVLRGMSGIIGTYRPTLFIEMHDEVYNLPKVRSEVLNFLDSVFYDVHSIRQADAKCYYLVAQPSERGDDHEVEVVKAGQPSPEPKNEPREIKIAYHRERDGVHSQSKAYVAEEPDENGEHVGIDKYTDEPLRVRWDDDEEKWWQV